MVDVKHAQTQTSHVRRARTRGPGVDPEFCIAFMRIVMHFHINDQIEQANAAERRHLFRKGPNIVDPRRRIAVCCEAQGQSGTQYNPQTEPIVAPAALTANNVRSTQF